MGDKNMNRGVEITLGVTETKSAYRGVDLIKGLVERDYEVNVILPEGVTEYIGKKSFDLPGVSRILGGDSYVSDNFSAALGSDLLVISPASYDFTGRFAGGFGRDLLSRVAAGYPGPILLVPSMEWEIFSSQVAQRNLEELRNRGVYILEPHSGGGKSQAGEGYLEVPPGDVLKEIEEILKEVSLFEDKRVLVTSGPGREPLGDYGFITTGCESNLGVYLGQHAKEMGGNVLLVSGPSSGRPPSGVGAVGVNSLRELDTLLMEEVSGYEVILMGGEVSNWRSVVRRGPEDDELTKKLDLKLKQAPDVVKKLGKLKESSQILIDFLAEREVDDEALDEVMEGNNLDGLFVLDTDDCNSPGGSRLLSGTLYFRSGAVERFPTQDKARLARNVLKAIGNRFFE